MKDLDRYLLIALFGGYIIKMLAHGATLPDAAVVLVLAGSHFLYNHFMQNKEITQLKQELNGIRDSIQKVLKDNEDLRNAVAGVKITQGLRNIK